MEKRKATDAECIAEWRTMISAFNDLVRESPTVQSIQDDLIELREAAKNSIFLNSRQAEAIIARCENYLKGEYGNTKTLSQMSQSKSGINK